MQNSKINILFVGYLHVLHRLPNILLGDMVHLCSISLDHFIFYA